MLAMQPKLAIFMKSRLRKLNRAKNEMNSGGKGMLYTWSIWPRICAKQVMIFNFTTKVCHKVLAFNWANFKESLPGIAFSRTLFIEFVNVDIDLDLATSEFALDLRVTRIAINTSTANVIMSPAPAESEAAHSLQSTDEVLDQPGLHTMHSTPMWPGAQLCMPMLLDEFPLPSQDPLIGHL